MPALSLWEPYTREQVHAIFSPNTTFTPQAGTWGLQGIVKIPDQPGSYVFFVTFGMAQGTHSFDESITEEGVLTWQSQPRQRLTDPMTQKFLNHDDRERSIYLFLRTHSDVPYTYCGRLGYLSHDDEREMPVHFQWQLLDWPAPPEVLDAMGLVVTPRGGTETSGVKSPEGRASGTLIEEDPPPGFTPGGTKTSKFKAVKRAFHPDRDALNKKLGLAGEQLVLEAEKRRLLEAGCKELAEAVEHASVTRGDGAGYDVKSFSTGGDVRYLEVKTTRSGPSAAFFISPNEVAFSDAHPDSFELVRVYDYAPSSQSGRCYRVAGSVSKSFGLEPSQYRAALR